ncbi:MAG TPA: triose-phosphate isomerase [Candidatus Thermoplasmatota archaeon]|nr:triose-phosphate isomerase [Candidatus Thermoplasmatota archaeon]
MALRPPIVIVNYKIYAQAVGRGALSLTAALERAAERTSATVVVCPNAVDLRAVAQATRLPTFAQHADPDPPGAGTGRVPVEAIAEAGAKGSLLNHAENRIPWERVGGAVARLRSAGLASVVCANDVEATREAARREPDMVAVEPPELIGGAVSVTSADPAIVRDAVRAVKSIRPGSLVLCGAGVKTGKDLAAALDLGADGVLLASGVTAAKDPGAALRDLLGAVA